MENWQLKQIQGLPLEIKIEKTKLRIKEWYEHWDGEVYVSFSGGKDSTVLLDLVRSIYPEVPAVFVDTGLEYPEIREFVKTISNVTWLKPEMHFKDVLDKYGYPIISKEQSQFIDEYRNCKGDKTKDIRFNGNRWGMGKISEKWKYLIDAPFKISNKCCNVMKKQPFKKYEKETNQKPFIGTMASESMLRQKKYLQNGCNAFEDKRPNSTPLGFWTEQDILLYLKQYDLPYAKVYGEIIQEYDRLLLTGVDRTGCMFCMFGCHLEKEPNRFQRMKQTHPKLYDYCINKLDLKKVLELVKVNY